MFSVAVTGFSELQVRLDSLEQALDVEEFLDEAAALLLGRIRERFLAQVDPDGNPWIESFAARERARRGVGGGTLYDTGRLFHSIQLFSSSPGDREIGTDVEYGPKLQYGLEGNPPRVFLGFGQDDLNLAEQLLLRRIDQATST